jgi:hypothetical protein
MACMLLSAVVFSERNISKRLGVVAAPMPLHVWHPTQQILPSLRMLMCYVALRARLQAQHHAGASKHSQMQ